MQKIILLLATGFGIGKLPLAPGTFGTLLGVLLYMAIASLSSLHYSVTVIGLLFISVWSSSEAEKMLATKDPKEVVIDEILGLVITMAFLPFNFLTIFVGFLLFRFFDVVKIFPCRWLERNCKAGWGIVLDDVVAGIYAHIILRIVILFLDYEPY